MLCSCECSDSVLVAFYLHVTLHREPGFCPLGVGQVLQEGLSSNNEFMSLVPYRYSDSGYKSIFQWVICVDIVVELISSAALQLFVTSSELTMHLEKH